MRQKLIWQGMQVIEKMERETGLEPATSSLGSWHSTTELLPHSGIQPHYSTSICTCVLRLDHFQQGPAGQRGGLVVQEHDAAGFGEWRVRTDRLAIERHLLQNLPVGGSPVSSQALLLSSPPPQPSESRQLAGLARIGQPFLQLVDFAGRANRAPSKWRIACAPPATARHSRWPLRRCGCDRTIPASESPGGSPAG